MPNEFKTLWEGLEGFFTELPTYDELMEQKATMMDVNPESAVPTIEEVLAAVYSKKGIEAGSEQSPTMIELQTFCEEQHAKEPENPMFRNTDLNSVWNDSISAEARGFAGASLLRRAWEVQDSLANAGLSNVIDNDPQLSSMNRVVHMTGASRNQEAANPGFLDTLSTMKTRESYDKCDRFLKAVTEAGAKAAFEGTPGYDKYADVLAHSTFHIESDGLDLYDQKYNDSYFGNPYSQHDISSYLKNMRQFGKNGTVDNAINFMGMDDEALSRTEIYPAVLAVRKLQENFRNRKPQEAGAAIPEDTRLPMFSREDVQHVREACNSYFTKYGFENTLENKVMREISRAASRADVFLNEHRVPVSEKENAQFQNMSLKDQMKNLNKESKEQDGIIKSRLNLLNTQLEKVSKSTFGNSKEFEYMRKTLNDMSKKDTLRKEDFKALQDAAKFYMDQKGDSKRTFDKGQIRYDIANDLYDLSENMSKMETSKEDLEAVKDRLEGKTKKSMVETMNFRQLESENKSGLSQEHQKAYMNEMKKTILKSYEEKKNMERERGGKGNEK